MQKHRNLVAWIKCMVLISIVYKATRSFPREELFALTQQLRKAAVSAAANIAEGYARYGAGELSHALSIALGSLAEVDTLIEVARNEGYLTDETYRALIEATCEASRVTLALQRSNRR
jgi:four helix bundle protein